MLEEEKLIGQAQSGNAESFGTLYDHYAKPVYRFIFLKVSNKSIAEDLLHEVFLSAWQNINGYNSRGFPFSSWLYQIARNRVIDHYRAHREFIDLDDVEEKVASLANLNEENLEKMLGLEKIKKAIDYLNEDQKDIIIMRFVNDLSPVEIASILDKSEGAVRLMQHRAIANLKKIIKEQN